MTPAFAVDLILLTSALLAAVLGLLLLLLGLYDLAMAYWKDDRDRGLAAVAIGVTALLLVGGGYLLQFGI